jgi:hypothetical protein
LIIYNFFKIVGNPNSIYKASLQLLFWLLSV